MLGVTSVGDRRDIFEKYNQLIENLNRKPDAFKARDREKGQLFADQAGLFALVLAGYDASAMATFWDRITGIQGKKGSWITELFGTTRPEEKRMRESDDGYFYGDFPKTEEVDRNIAKFNLNNGDAVSGPKIESSSSHQFGQYLFTIKSAKAKDNKPGEVAEKKPTFNPMLFRRDVIIEMFDARTMKSLWGQAFHERGAARMALSGKSNDGPGVGRRE